MRLSVHHVTHFEFDRPSGHSIHDVRLTPKPATGQRIISWRIDGPGKRSEWTDGHGNQVTTFSVAHQHSAVEIVVTGLYDYSGADQWLRYADTPTLPAPFWLRNTGMARHDASFDPVIAGLQDGVIDPTKRVSVLHELMARVRDRMAYKTGVSTVDTTAIEALARGAGVAQDTAHVFIACCRRLGVPARYVSGYLRNDDPELHVGHTSHSWAEAWVPGLDWVGFDPANGISPRGDSLRVAIGLDYHDAAPVSGRRIGFGDARMTVDAEVKLVG
ncbi:Transglutaminase-like enzyme, putative cysteine protease [Enhydrobacter aerosaccus]|uniref:Transglutaminase-like enzyme, putative cysteine protease n=1 Tax=Enhydrobacter aerosaccus TaxID=225324 RepID=A0A1T4JNM5_9HYPH|nr:transglutaminase family protein [Enhydrobacter aerosaccus]SJZ31792.1 Transglutaminase-like enzyme, putative cysteine protease [Enhydrobacter aerosaccus]